jgi:hypothetical protein
MRLPVVGERNVTSENSAEIWVIDTDAAVEQAKAQLTPGDFEAAWQAGERMTRDEAIELALGG